MVWMIIFYTLVTQHVNWTVYAIIVCVDIFWMSFTLRNRILLWNLGRSMRWNISGIWIDYLWNIIDRSMGSTIFNVRFLWRLLLRVNNISSLFYSSGLIVRIDLTKKLSFDEAPRLFLCSFNVLIYMHYVNIHVFFHLIRVKVHHFDFFFFQNYNDKISLNFYVNFI